MQTKVIFLLTLLSVLSICSIAFCQATIQEEITLSTYYPAPYGEYDELCAEKVLVWRPDGQELADMSEGDCHIGGSLIVGAGGTGFSYDELELIGATPLAQGTVLISGNVGIGTTTPAAKLHVDGNVSIGRQNDGVAHSKRLKIAALGDVYGIHFYIDDYFDAELYGTRMWKQHQPNGVGLRIDTQNNDTWIPSVYIGHGGQAQDPLFGVFGGAVIGSGYATQYSPPADGLLVQGNVGIGTTSPTTGANPNGDTTGNLDTNDVWLRGANAGAGGWASNLAATLPLTDVALSVTSQVFALMVAAVPSTGKVYVRSLENAISGAPLDDPTQWGSWVDFGAPDPSSKIIEISTALSVTSRVFALITARMSDGKVYVRSLEGAISGAPLDDPTQWGSWVDFGNPGL